MAATRFTQADLSRALAAWVKAGQEVGEALILPDGTIRLRPPATVDTDRPATQKPGLEGW